MTFGASVMPARAQGGDSLNWEAKCVEQGCVLHTELLRGDNGDPPDASDYHEYVAIDVAFDHRTRKPAYFAFHVNPDAQAAAGISIGFAKAAKSGDNPALDADGASRLDISDCDDKTCVARVPLGLTKKGPDSHSLNLLEKFLKSDQLVLLYAIGGKTFRTTAPLASFQQEYQRLASMGFSSAGR